MGLENLSVGARSALLEVGRMAYGSREGAAGGKGHIGLLNANGVSCVIKFDTHGGSTGGAGAIQSGDALRDLLKTIAESAGLPKDTLQEIRKALGLSPNDNPGAGQPKAVFDRTVAAKVVELIGGKEIWREVKATFNKDVYKSRGDTSYDSVINQANGEDTNNAKEIGSIETFTEEALQKHLDDVLNPTLKKIFGDPERKDLVAANNQFSRELKDGVKTIDDMNAKLKKIFVDHRWRRSNLDAAMKLLRHTLKGGGTIGSMLANVDLPKAVSRDDLNKAFTNLLVTVAVANRGDVKTSKFLDAIDKTLENVAELDFSGLSPERRLAVSKNAKLLAWCEKIATEYDVANADDLKAAVLRRLFDQDLRNESDDSTEVMEKFAFGDKTVEKTGSKSRLDALKAVLGQLKTPKERALENIKKFVTLAAENGNRADFYLKRSEDGKGLTSAGSRNIFRGSTSRDENNDVRAWLKQNLVTYYGSEGQIPGRVRQELTNFEGGGHPLSAERVDQILEADFDAYAEKYRAVDPQERNNKPGEIEKYGDDDHQLVRGRAKALNDQIDERMHFHPEVKMNYVISAIES